MKADDLQRFGDDLREHTGVNVELEIDPKPDGLHVLSVDGADFYFYADGSGYDGWGKALTESEGNDAKRTIQTENVG